MAASRQHVLAVDVGTSVIRATAVALDGAFLATSRAATRTTLSGDTATLDGAELWTDVRRQVRAVIESAGVPVAIGVSSMLGTILVDGSLDPVAPAMLWQDRRAAGEAAELAAELGGRSLTIAGRRPAPELAAPRARWTARHDPDAWSRTRRLITLKDFLVARFTGAVATDATSASYSLLFDVRKRRWSPELLRAAGIEPDRLADVRSADEAAGGLATAVAADLGLPSGLPVAVGGPDGSVAALGCGADRPGVTVDVAGTTDVVVHVVDRPVADPAGRAILNAGLLPGLWTLGGPTGLTGGTIAWLAGILGHGSVDAASAALGAAADVLPPGAGGVALRPSLSGERFPTWDPAATGTIAGLRPEHTAAHLLRAAEEGAAFHVREGLEALEALGVGVGEVRVSGGITRRPSAMRLRADAWRRRVVGVADPEATTVGAALLAAVAGRAVGSVGEAVSAMVRLDPPLAPTPGSGPAWDAAYRRWQDV